MEVVGSVDLCMVLGTFEPPDVGIMECPSCNGTTVTADLCGISYDQKPVLAAMNQ